MKSVTRDGRCGELATVLKGFHHQQFCKKCLLDVENTFIALSQKVFDWVCEGIVKKPSSVVMELTGERVIEVSVESHALLQVNGEEVSGIEHAQVLNLSDDGERWEGDVLNNQPFGWGVLYDSEGEKKYEGFRMGEVNVCYGIQYYSDIQKVEYKGEWCEGMRWGRGVQYDRNGSIVFDGEWMNDQQLSKRVLISHENQLLHNHVEELIVSDECCNGEEWRVLDLSLMPNLRELRIGNECFKNVDEMKLIGLDYLEKVEIGNNCFVMREYEADSNRHFVLKDCERLRGLKIGCGSFMDYCTCEMEDADALEVVQMGDLEVESACFFCGSLRMRSEWSEKRVMNRLAEANIDCAWRRSASEWLQCRV